MNYFVDKLFLEKITRNYFGLNTDSKQNENGLISTVLSPLNSIFSGNTKDENKPPLFDDISKDVSPETDKIQVTQKLDNNDGYVSDTFKESVYKWITLLLATIMIFYWIGSFLCQLVGLYYPIYCLHMILATNQNGELTKHTIVSTYIKYFVIYGHFEILFHIISLILSPMYYIRLIILSILILSIKYRPELIDTIHAKLIFSDINVYNFIRIKIKKLLDYT